VSALDRELQQYGARINAEKRKSPKFGAQPGYGLISSRREGVQPEAVSDGQGGMKIANLPPGQFGFSRPGPGATQPPAAPASPAPAQLDRMEEAAPVGGPGPSPEPEQIPVGVINPSSPQPTAEGAFADQRAALDKSNAERRSRYAAEDAEFESRKAGMAAQRQSDREQGERNLAESRAFRVTEDWQGERKDSPVTFRGTEDVSYEMGPRGRRKEVRTGGNTLTLAGADRDGKQYRPKGWTQEDEDISAEAAERGARLSRLDNEAPLLDIISGGTLSRRQARAMRDIRSTPGGPSRLQRRN
jgi:hypothetical protein